MKNKNLKTEDLKKYASGALSDKEANRVERSLLEQPLYADAVEGFEAIKQDKIDLETTNNDLKNRLLGRVKVGKIAKTPTKIIPLWQSVSIAASVLLLIGLGLYLFNENTDNQAVSINQNPKKEDVAAKETESLKDEKSIDKTIIQPNAKPKSNAAPIINSDSYSDSEMANATIIESKSTITEEVLSEAPLTAAAPVEKPKPEEIRSRETKKEAEGNDKADLAKESAPPPMPRSSAEGSRLGGSMITGTVVDEDNEPLKGVAIYLKGTTKTAKTDEKGQFFMDGLRKGNSLIMNFNAMPTQEVFVNNSIVGKIIYSEDPNKLNKFEPKVKKVGDPQDLSNFIDTRPEFGWIMYQDYLKENTKMPAQALEKGIKGKVNIRFKVNEEGQISDLQITKSVGYGCDQEAIRLITEGPKWFPAFRYGKKTTVTKTVIIKFGE